jgi:hypothetical protein
MIIVLAQTVPGAEPERILIDCAVFLVAIVLGTVGICIGARPTCRRTAIGIGVSVTALGALLVWSFLDGNAYDVGGSIEHVLRHPIMLLVLLSPLALGAMTICRALHKAQNPAS